MSRKNIIALAILAVSLAGLISARSANKNAQTDYVKNKEELTALQSIKTDYTALKSKIDAIEAKKNLSKTTGVVQAIDDIASGLGLKSKVKSVKVVSTKDVKDSTEEEADIIMERMSMNEAVNFLYKAENAPMTLVIKKALFRQAFDNPAQINISMTVSLIRQK